MNIDTGKYIIAAIGIAMLAAALYWVQSTRHFLAQSSTAQGTVVALLPEGRDIARAPVVRFVTANGDNIEFTSDTRSNPPGYTQGQRVEVLYHPDAPRDAKISDFGSLWGGPIALGCFGSIFLLVGGGIVLAAARKGRKEA